MSDEDLNRYARDLAAEVDEAGAVYSEEEFTRLVLDKLGDEAVIENPVALYQEGRFGRTRYKITGFAIPDAEDRLLLVTTVHTGVVPPRSLTAEEIRTALIQAANFYRWSCDGLHAKIEPSNTDASDLARRIFEIQTQIEVVRVVLISDGMTGLRSIDVKDAKDGTRILVDMYGIERLHRILGGKDDMLVSTAGIFLAETLPFMQEPTRRGALRLIDRKITKLSGERQASLKNLVQRLSPQALQNNT
jgi:hypothetical protein